MSVFYTLASASERKLLDTALERWHEHLLAEDVQIGLIRAEGKDFKDALVNKGHSAYALVRIVPLRDRLTKHYDAEMLFDGRLFDKLTEAQRLAMFDHELTHLRLKMEKENGIPTSRVDRDDLGRPKLQMRNGDWNAGDGFSEVIERHGQVAIEFANLRMAYGLAEAAVERSEPLG